MKQKFDVTIASEVIQSVVEELLGDDGIRAITSKANIRSAKKNLFVKATKVLYGAKREFCGDIRVSIRPLCYADRKKFASERYAGCERIYRMIKKKCR